MNIKSIIFLVETPILNRYYERYGIELLRQQGFDTTIFDLSPLLLPIAYKTITTDLCDYEFYGFERFFSLGSFREKLKEYNNKNTLIICSMGYKWEYRKVFREIRRQKIEFCYFMQELSPLDTVKISQKITARLSFHGIKRAITRRIPKQFHGVSFAKFIIGCGDNPEAIMTYKKARLCKTDCPVYYFHSSNYEECLIENNCRIIQNRYCVFVDQYIPYHPDNIEAGLVINPAEYYKKMNLLFDEIEKALHIEVVVAAHPRSDYNTHTNCFNKRRVIKNKTCNLVKYSEFVIYHSSNSFSYAAVFKKPVIVVSTKEISAFFENSISIICNLLGTSNIDIDAFLKIDNKIEKLNELLKIDDSMYEAYIKKYMKKGYNGVLEGEKLWLQIGGFLASNMV